MQKISQWLYSKEVVCTDWIIFLDFRLEKNKSIYLNLFNLFKSKSIIQSTQNAY